MKVFTLNPLLDSRWSEFVNRHPRASIFHTRGWIDALQRTYGYEPVVYTTAAPFEKLTNGLVFCRIDSWVTGRRLVSLPFSDHCEPLVDSREDWKFLTTSVIEEARWEGYKYVEMRPMAIQPQPDSWAGMAPSDSFYLHTVDLRPELKEIFLNFHRSCVQRKIRRAGREGLSCAEGRSPELMRQFYRLLITTRRRHQLPPQPIDWFENLVDCLDDLLSVRVAYKGSQPIASILTLSFKGRAYYKYGGSDERFHSLGGTQLLLWHTIQREKECGRQILDMGRSEIGHTSLANFKDHWGCTRSLLPYYRYPPASGEHKIRSWSGGVARYAFARLPNSLLAAAGRILYPHIG
jgi:Acetyltransferase (GNAT) domain